MKNSPHKFHGNKEILRKSLRDKKSGIPADAGKQEAGNVADTKTGEHIPQKNIKGKSPKPNGPKGK